jgi:hypothetical protein
MGISNIGRAKSEGTDWITHAGRALREAAVGDGRRPSDAVPVVQPANGAARAGDHPHQSDPPRTGAPIRISHLLETAQRPKNCQFLSLERDRSRTWAF